MAAPNYAFSGGVSQNRTAIVDDSDTSKQFQFNATPLATQNQVVLTADAANDGAIAMPPFSSAVLAAMNLVTQTSVPATASTITVSATTQIYIAVPAGTLTTLNINLPSAPPDGTVVRVVSSAAVTNLNMGSQGADTFVGAPTALTANVPKGFVYLASGTKWYQI